MYLKNLLILATMTVFFLSGCIAPDDSRYQLADKRPAVVTVVVTATPQAPVNQQQQQLDATAGQVISIWQRILGIGLGVIGVILLVLILAVAIPLAGFGIMVSASFLKFFITEW